jgi:hypothetical protein
MLVFLTGALGENRDLQASQMTPSVQFAKEAIEVKEGGNPFASVMLKLQDAGKMLASKFFD